MHITKIRLLGFKSFVEPTELLISKGLTGVVGPNGCGKSNLLEALRWVMGETSHKSMRGSSMDDVIFSGTSTRPERTSAEVTIFLDNTARRAPAEHNGADVIEITRRIEREAGSAYRINGRDVRARDVKILFEDAATGARSPALVRQGQISELVNAKPEQRRRVLEDAAGIAGLHSRRHEAELRLKAAEANMARIGDVIGQVQSQMESLKRQARQAKRYKELSTELRRAEALLLHLLWHTAQSEVDAQEALLASTLIRLAEVTERESASLREEGETAEQIQPLREDEAGKGAAVHRITIEQETFEKEAERLAHRQQELEGRQGQLQRDLQREEAQVGEAKELLTKLEGDRTALVEQEAASELAEETARAKLAESETHLQQKEARLAEATRLAFEHRARMKSLEAAAVDRKAAIERLKRQVTTLEQQTREIALKAPDASKLRTLEENGQRLSAALVDIERQATTAEEKVAEAAAVARERRDASQLGQIAASQLRTEMETLTKLLGPIRSDGPAGVIDLLRVAPGYEIALGAALGEDLDAPIAPEAPLHWRRIGMGDGDAALPADVEPLIKHVEGPSELVRRLRQIGVVTRDEGPLLQPELLPGQRLVSLEGDLWRWDGYTATANAPTAAALRLAERNRLGDIVRRESEAR
ncbi:MAG TPA: AAA family ATPase, partial [Hyphomicrobiaceae bacterium]|nr:AAA family ATPase [Hyphomicrobiaceae bacterium]